MRRIKLTVEYDGTQFAGLQTQAQGQRTVQTVLEQALSRIPGAIPKVVAAGRTDAGVHALAMPFHYDTEDAIPPERIPLALNSSCPPTSGPSGPRRPRPDFTPAKAAAGGPTATAS